MRVDSVRVTFSTSDRKYPHLEPTANKFALFLLNNKSMLDDYNKFLKISPTWGKNTYKEEIDKWFGRSYRRSKAKDHLDFKELIIEFFDKCNDDEEIKKMRGLVPEKLIETIFAHKYFGTSVMMRVGAKVYVDGVLVRYYINQDEKKSTVDIGTWDNERAQFVEIKCSPRTFRSKDVEYLRKLAARMQQSALRYETYLVSLYEREFLQSYLEEECLWDHADHFLLIGKNEIFNLHEIIS